MSGETPIRFTSEITVRLVDHMGGDHSAVAAAKVCTCGPEVTKLIPDSKDPEARARQAQENAGLINYLMKHRHGTPFEHNCLCFYVHAPIFVWREWHRHRIGFSYNEESGRYSKLKPLFYLPADDRPMMKVEGWKPGRPKFLECTDDTIIMDLEDNLRNSYRQAYEAYETNLELGIDPGLARDCLPVGIYSSCWVTCNARSLMSFLSLRTHDESAQFVSYPLYEIEDAARQVEDIFAQLFPTTYQAFCNNGRVAP